MNKADELYRTLIEPIESRMIGAITRLVHDEDEAADALQNALEEIWKNLERIARHPNPHGYILRLCVSAAYDALRKRSRQRRRWIPWGPAHDGLAAAGNGHATAGIEESEAIGEEEQRRRAVLAAIAQLPPKQAQAVILRVHEEQSFESIAQAFGCREATARSHFSKGVARLRVILNGEHPRKELGNEYR